MKPTISTLAAIVLADALIAGCRGGHAVRVDCDGPLSLINPPAAVEAQPNATRHEPAAAQPDASAKKRPR